MEANLRPTVPQYIKTWSEWWIQSLGFYHYVWVLNIDYISQTYVKHMDKCNDLSNCN